MAAALPRVTRVVFAIGVLIAEKGYAPSVREIGAYLFLAHSAVVVEMDIAETRGYIESGWVGDRRAARSWRVTAAGRMLLRGLGDE